MGVFTMPSLGADMEAGKLVEWLIKPGDTVARGDVVAVVETQKGAIEIEVFEDGTVHELTAELGTELPVGTPLAVILAKGEAPPAPSAPSASGEPAVDVPPVETAPPAVAKPTPPAAEPTPAAAEPTPAAAEPTPATAEPTPAAAEPTPTVAVTPALPVGQHNVSPAARVRAHELGVDLSAIQGSGPGGVIVLADLEQTPTVAKQPPSKPGSPMEEMRKAIAKAMTRSKQTIPHFYLSETIDVQPAIDFLTQLNTGRPPSERILLGALFVRATSLAAAKVKTMNGHFVDGVFKPADVVNPGVAVALRGGGLVAPALMDAASLDLDQTMAGMRDLVTRARAGRLKGSEMTEGTITISSLGETGTEAMIGVIFPPQVALVGIGAPHIRPWVVDGQVVPRSVLTLTMSADHRVSDGRQVARFISEFETLMQEPERL
jgi:pyruvate dehydrogenase E2 component (dihydrolipoamide acetyltransferase)